MSKWLKGQEDDGGAAVPWRPRRSWSAPRQARSPSLGESVFTLTRARRITRETPENVLEAAEAGAIKRRGRRQSLVWHSSQNGYRIENSCIRVSCMDPRGARHSGGGAAKRMPSSTGWQRRATRAEDRKLMSHETVVLAIDGRGFGELAPESGRRAMVWRQLEHHGRVADR